MYMYIFICIDTHQHSFFEEDSQHFAKCYHFPALWQSITDFSRTTVKVGGRQTYSDEKDQSLSLSVTQVSVSFSK